MAETFKLANGATIPAIGFGTWEITPSNAAQKAVTAALKAGYRLIDTAKIYGNEDGVGQAIKESELAREDLYITTKLWNDDQGHENALQAIDESLKLLQLEYVDLYLVHWPVTGMRAETWQAMTMIEQSGKAKAIGVSNFTVRHLQELAKQTDVTPAVNQVEFHPFIYEQQKELLEYCKQHGILIEAYSPLSRYSDADTSVIDTIAERLGKSSQQIMLRWCYQHGTIALPRSTNENHMTNNFQIFDFELSNNDMTALNRISDGQRVTSDPEDIA